MSIADAHEYWRRERKDARQRYSDLLLKGDAVDPRDVSDAYMAAYPGDFDDALVIEAIRHSWLVRTGRPLDSCRCIRCSEGSRQCRACKGLRP
jgi:hypothetical protein